MLTITILTVITFFVIAYTLLRNYNRSYDRSYHKFITSHKAMYCYDTSLGPPNPVLYVSDKKYLDSLKKYYREIEHGNPSPTFNFPIYMIPTKEKVYVLSYNKDSTIAKVAFDTSFRTVDGSNGGYVYAHLLHSQKPKYDRLKK